MELKNAKPGEVRCGERFVAVQVSQCDVLRRGTLQLTHRHGSREAAEEERLGEKTGMKEIEKRGREKQWIARECEIEGPYGH